MSQYKAENSKFPSFCTATARMVTFVFGNSTVVFGNSAVVFGNSTVVFGNSAVVFGNWNGCIRKLGFRNCTVVFGNW